MKNSITTTTAKHMGEIKSYNPSRNNIMGVRTYIHTYSLIFTYFISKGRERVTLFEQTTKSHSTIDILITFLNLNTPMINVLVKCEV